MPRITEALKNRRRTRTKFQKVASRKRRRSLSSKPSVQVVKDYQRDIDRWLKVLIDEIIKDLSPLLRSFDTSQLDPNVTRSDAATPEVNKAFDFLTTKLSTRLEGKSLEDFVRRRGLQQKLKTKKQIDRVLGLAFDPDIEHLLEDFVGRNTNLITKLSRETLKTAREEVSKATNIGLRHEVLRDNLIKKLGFSKGRASLIARDQMLKFNANITKETHLQAGITEYIWTTSGDGDRVRESHQELEGERFSYLTGAPSLGGLNPGEDFQCRCTAYPVVPFLL